MKAYCYDSDGYFTHAVDVVQGEEEVEEYVEDTAPPSDPLDEQAYTPPVVTSGHMEKVMRHFMTYPCNATLTVPPGLADGQRARWDGFQWLVEGVDILYCLNTSGTYHLPTCGFAGDSGEQLSLSAIVQANPNVNPCSRCKPPALVNVEAAE